MPPIGLGAKLNLSTRTGFVIEGNPRGLWQWAQLPIMYPWAASS